MDKILERVFWTVLAQYGWIPGVVMREEKFIQLEP